jgi:hypothetical protein
MKLKEQTFVIDNSGNVVTIFDDQLSELVANGGSIVTRRASHVEPELDGGLWSADLSPVNGPTFTGFRTRQEALDAELEWLSKNLPKLKFPK